MAVDGNWNITMSTPIGRPQRHAEPEECRRRADGDAGRRRQFHRDLRRHRQRRRRRLESPITNPMPLTLAFTGKVSGDSISGEMGIGPMGSFPFNGTRRKAPRARRAPSPRSCGERVGVRGACPLTRIASQSDLSPQAGARLRVTPNLIP